MPDYLEIATQFHPCTSAADRARQGSNLGPRYDIFGVPPETASHNPERASYKPSALSPQEAAIVVLVPLVVSGILWLSVPGNPSKLKAWARESWASR